jgi:hypothetical protein
VRTVDDEPALHDSLPTTGGVLPVALRSVTAVCRADVRAEGSIRLGRSWSRWNSSHIRRIVPALEALRHSYERAFLRRRRFAYARRCARAQTSVLAGNFPFPTVG